MMTFTDPIAAAQWGEEFFASVSHVLTEDEIDALRCYKQSEYLKINDTLRSTEDEALPPVPLPEVWTKIFRIDAAISKNPLPPVTLFRGQWLSPEKLIQFDSRELIGETIWNKGFCSTSLLVEEAQEYLLQFPHDSAVLKTETQLGIKGIYLDVEDIEDLRQYEILLSRSLGWKVLEAGWDTKNRRIVTAELVKRG